MGVSGLLVLLKSIQKPCNIKKFSGLTLGVDAYGWLHPGTIPCAVDLALGKPSTKYVEYAMHRVRMLLHYGITPYVVLDGNYLPSKAGTEIKRAASREEAKRKGLELLRMGKATAAHRELQKAVDVTPEMARNFIEELKRHKVKYVVAPYEADAQLAYLERQGLIDGIVSEDSDMLVFGAKRLITKLDKYGECVEINRDDFISCKTVSFFGWTDEMFRRMCILSGCDYLEGLPRLGVKTAHGLVRKHKDIERILRVLAFEGKSKIPPGYLEAYRRAELTFMHQWAFDPVQRKLVMGIEWKAADRPEDISFIGADMIPATAIGVANGNLHPMTKEPIRITVDASRKNNQKADPRTGKITEQRRETFATPSDIKGSKKPIDSFFKPRRTPLAELDPNIMTPSPTQQELLRRHSGTITSTAVDENNTPVQSFAAPSAARTTGALRRNRAISAAHNQPSSGASPSKRQRLCYDTSPAKDKSAQTKPVESGTSKFFASRIPEPSPSLKRQKKSRSNAGEFNILSDASLEDAMLTLAESQESVERSKKKLTVFHDTPADSATESRDSHNDSQESISTKSATSVSVSVESTATDDTSISLVPNTPPLREKLGRALRNRFSLGSTTPTPSASQNTTQSARPGSARSSALERMRDTAIAGPSLRRERISKAETISQDNPSTDDLPELPVWPGKVRAARINALCVSTEGASSTQGSEDFFVPNSEDGSSEANEGAAEDDVDDKESKPISFGQFAYAG